MAERSPSSIDKPKEKKGIIYRIKKALGLIKKVKRSNNTKQYQTNSSYIQDTTTKDKYGIEVQVRTFEKDTVYRPKRDQMMPAELKENKGGQRIVTKVNQTPNTNKVVQNIKDGVQPTKSILRKKISAQEMQEASKIRKKFNTEQITSYNKSNKYINPRSTQKNKNSSLSKQSRYLKK